MLAALLPVLGPILDRTLSHVIPDPAARQKAISEMYGQLAAADLAQMEVNKTEAQHRSVWVAGWRPSIGWACSLAFAWHFVVHPIAAACFVAFNLPYVIPPSGLDDRLLELLGGLLGLGALRSFEKLKGIAR